MNKLTISAMFVCSMFLAGCSDSVNYDFEQSIVDAQANFDETQAAEDAEEAKVSIKAVFDPASGKIPPTNDILFSDAESPTGLSQDGTLNIPAEILRIATAQRLLKRHSMS